MKRALITGANGFIGSNLSKFLIEKGWKVKGLVIKNTPLDFIKDLDIEIVYGDITQPDSIAGICKNIDVVFHLAAIAKDWGEEELFFNVNANGTKNMLEAAVKSNVPRFVLMSSIAVHKYSGHTNSDENALRDCLPNFPYGISKIMAEDFVKEYNDKNLIEGVIVRPGLFPFGPNDITSFFKLAQALEKRNFSYVNKGSAKLSTSYVENLCHGIELAGMVKEAKGQTYILSDGIEITWNELIEKFCSALGVKGNFISVPYTAANSAAYLLERLWIIFKLKKEPPINRYRTSLMKNDLVFSPDKAKKELGYSPSTSMDVMIKKTAEWYKLYKQNTNKN